VGKREGDKTGLNTTGRKRGKSQVMGKKKRKRKLKGRGGGEETPFVPKKGRGRGEFWKTKLHS